MANKDVRQTKLFSKIKKEIHYIGWKCGTWVKHANLIILEHKHVEFFAQKESE